MSASCPAEYERLLRLAGALLRGGGSADPAEVVHEALLRLEGAAALPVEMTDEHRHRLLARTVARVVIDLARRRRRETQRVCGELVEPRDEPSVRLDLVLDVTEAVAALGEIHRRTGDLVRACLERGCSPTEAGRAVGMNPRSARRGFELGAGWLRSRLGRGWGRAVTSSR